MKRRSLLTTVGAASAPLSVGCLDNSAAGSSNGASDPTEENGDENGNGSVNTFERTVSIATVDEVLAEAPVEFEVNVVENGVDENGTASLEITSTNVGNSTHRAVPYYKGRSADDGTPGILLYALTAPDSPSADYTPDCITDPEPAQEFIGFTEEAHAPELQPEETRTEEYMVVDDPSVEGCFPPGEYRFERNQRFETADGEIDFEWGFTIEISDTY